SSTSRQPNRRGRSPTRASVPTDASRDAAGSRSTSRDRTTSSARPAGSGARTRRRREAYTPTRREKRDGERADRPRNALGDTGEGGRAGGDPARAGGGRAQSGARLPRLSTPPIEEEPGPLPLLRAVPLGRGLRCASKGPPPRRLPRAS